MRAVVSTDFGSPLELAQLDVPTPAAGEVRVRVRAASINGFDTAVAAGYLGEMMEHRFPVVLGKDFAGTVDALGDGVSGFAAGDRVFGVVTKSFIGDGSFGEYVTVPAAVGIAKLPDAVDFVEGAALGLAGATAVSVITAANLSAGKTVLISGATGGVGTAALQLALAAGARVIVTAHSEESKALVRSLGATDIVDYTADVPAQVRAIHAGGVDVVLHFAGDAAALLPAIAVGGSLVSTLISSPDQLESGEVTVVPVYSNPTEETLDLLAANQASLSTRVVVQKVYALEETAAAFAHFGAGKLGKIVVTID